MGWTRDRAAPRLAAVERVPAPPAPRTAAIGGIAPHALARRAGGVKLPEHQTAPARTCVLAFCGAIAVTKPTAPVVVPVFLGLAAAGPAALASPVDAQARPDRPWQQWFTAAPERGCIAVEEPLRTGPATTAVLPAAIEVAVAVDAGLAGGKVIPVGSSAARRPSSQLVA